VSNYVPYDGYPKGETAPADTTTEIEDEKWKKNYVAYDGEEKKAKQENGKE